MSAANSVTMETNSLVERYDFTWKIHNFSRYLDRIESAVFNPLPNMKTQFSVSIFYNEYKASLACTIKLKINTLVEGKEDEKISNTLRVECDLKITNVEGAELMFSKKSPRILNSFKELLVVTWTVDIEKDWSRWNIFGIKTVPSDDTVIVTMHFEFYGHDVTTKSRVLSLMKTPQQNLSILSTDLKNIYNSKTLTDITIQIDDSVVQAHRTILAARSPVFRRMLEGSFLESKTKSLAISDVDFDVFDCFLKYLYSGDVDDKTFSTMYRLYSVADKYEVLALQKECAEALASNLNSENVCSVLELCHIHNDDGLRDKAACFVSSCFSEIRSTPEWKDILKRYPDLGSEVLGVLSDGLKILQIKKWRRNTLITSLLEW